MPAQSPASPDVPQQIHWEENGVPHSARWRSESGMPPPKRVVIADDRTNADTAYRLACEGTALLWRGDFQNARQLLQALGRRLHQAGVERRGHRQQQRALGARGLEHLAGLVDAGLGAGDDGLLGIVEVDGLDDLAAGLCRGLAAVAHGLRIEAGPRCRRIGPRSRKLLPCGEGHQR